MLRRFGEIFFSLFFAKNQPLFFAFYVNVIELTLGNRVKENQVILHLLSSQTYFNFCQIRNSFYTDIF